MLLVMFKNGASVNSKKKKHTLITGCSKHHEFCHDENQENWIESVLNKYVSI